MTNMIKFKAVGNTKQCLIIAFLMNYIKLNDINSIRYMNSEGRYIDFLLNRLVSYDELAKEGVLIDGFYYNRRSNSINKDQKNFIELSKKFNNPNTFALPYTTRGKSSYKTSRMSAII